MAERDDKPVTDIEQPPGAAPADQARSEGETQSDGAHGGERLKIDPDANVPDYRVEPVPQVPRRLRPRLSAGNLMRIGFLAALLAMVIVARKPCSAAVSNFVHQFEEQPPARQGSTPDDPRETMKLERLSEEEIKERFPSGDQGSESAPAGDSAESAKDAPER